MLVIRRFEEKVEERFRAGDLAGFLHACIGQEAIAVGVCRALAEDDLIASTHRAHGHVLANGTPAYEGTLPHAGNEFEEPRSAAEGAVDATLREVAAEAEDVQVERRVVQGAPAAVLVEQSRGADLLVVGSRGLGGFAQLLLGSVSQQCAHHTECPVVIVRSRPTGN
jgi:TPP-dependent pyruvate/acetoin dehydrogenase alpha subunit